MTTSDDQNHNSPDPDDPAVIPYASRIDDPHRVIGYRGRHTVQPRSNTTAGCVEAPLGFVTYFGVLFIAGAILSEARVESPVPAFVLITLAFLALGIYIGGRYRRWSFLAGTSAALLIVGGLVALLASICGGL